MELKALDSLSSKAEAQLLNYFFFHEVTPRNTKGRKEKANYKNSSSLFKFTFSDRPMQRSVNLIPGTGKMKTKPGQNTNEFNK
jgi:hypothetical protein